MASEARKYHRRKRGATFQRPATPHRDFDFTEDEDVADQGHEGDDESTPPPRSRKRKAGLRPFLGGGRKRRSSSIIPEPQKKRSRTKKARAAALKNYIPKVLAEAVRQYFREVDEEVLEEMSASNNSEGWLTEAGDQNSQEIGMSPNLWENNVHSQQGPEELAPGSLPPKGSAGRDLQNRSSDSAERGHERTPSGSARRDQQRTASGSAGRDQLRTASGSAGQDQQRTGSGSAGGYQQRTGSGSAGGDQQRTGSGSARRDHQRTGSDSARRDEERPTSDSPVQDKQRTASGPSRTSSGSGGRRVAEALQFMGHEEPSAVRPVLSARRPSPRDSSSPLGMPTDGILQEQAFMRPKSARKHMELMETLHEEGGARQQQPPQRRRPSDLWHWETVGLASSAGVGGLEADAPDSGAKRQGAGSGSGSFAGKGGALGKGVGEEEREDNIGGCGGVGNDEEWEWGEGSGQAGRQRQSQPVGGRQDAQSPAERQGAIAARLKQAHVSAPQVACRRPLQILEPVEEVTERSQTASHTQPTKAGSRMGNSGMLSPSSSVAGPQAACAGKGLGPEGAEGASGFSAHAAPQLRPASLDSRQSIPMPEPAAQMGATGSTEAARDAVARMLESSGAQRDKSGLQNGCENSHAYNGGPGQNGAAPPARKSSLGIPFSAPCVNRSLIEELGATASAEKGQGGSPVPLNQMPDLPAATDKAPGVSGDAAGIPVAALRDKGEEPGKSNADEAGPEGGHTGDARGSREEEVDGGSRMPVGSYRLMGAPGDASAMSPPCALVHARSVGRNTDPAALGAPVEPHPGNVSPAGQPGKQSIGVAAGFWIPPEQEQQAQGTSPQLALADASHTPPQPCRAQAGGLGRIAQPAASGAVVEHETNTPAAVRPVKQSIGVAAAVQNLSERESHAPETRPSLPRSTVGRSAQLLSSIARHFSRSSVGPGALFPGTPLSRSDTVKGHLGGGIPFNLSAGPRQSLAGAKVGGAGANNNPRRSLAPPRYAEGSDADAQGRRQMWRRKSLSGVSLWQAEQEQAQRQLKAQGENQAEQEQEEQSQDETGTGAGEAKSDAAERLFECATDSVPAQGASIGNEAVLHETEKENQGPAGPPSAKQERQGRKASIGISLRDAGARLNQKVSDPEAGKDRLPKGAGVVPDPSISAYLQSEDEEEVGALQRMLEMGKQNAPSGLEHALSEFCNVEDITKLGEGSYAEVFGVLSEVPRPGTRGAPINSVCFKIVPMGGPAVDGEEQKPVSELETEAAINIALNRLREERNRAGQKGPAARTVGFIELKGVRVCVGAYPKVLLDCWTAYDEQFESENLNPSCYPDTQLYCVLALEMGGQNLEEYRIKSFDEAKAIIFQTTAALAAAEEECQFEHRDLHWGNVMVSQTSQLSDSVTLSGQTHEFKTWDLKVSIIDFTLSRVHTGERVIFCDLAKDKELFEGPEGDTQFDTYREMKKLARRKWNAWHPKTNVLWLAYLLEMVSKRKMLVLSPHEDRLVAAFKKKVMRADTLKGLIQDKFFEGILVQEPGA